MMNARCNDRKFSRMAIQDEIPSEVPSSREQVDSGKGKIGTYTRAHPDKFRKQHVEVQTDEEATVYVYDSDFS